MKACRIDEQAPWSCWRAGKKRPSRKGLGLRGFLRGHPKHDRRAEATSFRPFKTKQKQHLPSPWHVVHVPRCVLYIFKSPSKLSFLIAMRCHQKRAAFLFLFRFFLEHFFFSLRFTHHPKASDFLGLFGPPPRPPKKPNFSSVWVSGF